METVKKHTWALKLYFSIVMITAAFSILHYPYVKELGYLSATVLLMFYPSRYLYKANKYWLDHLKIFLVILIGINTFFHYRPLVIVQMVVFFVWFVNEGLYYFNFSFKFNQENTSQDILDEEIQSPIRSNLNALGDIVFVVSIVVFISGNVFKVIHWPFAAEQILLGALGLAISIWGKKF